ncbi:hypothetical protein DS524_27620, partial [Salmonella enterica subsp. enterica serovar Chester]|nr:hypothetical protein [Salmonella enterica subsp. enterica serovar Chester]
MQYVAADSCFSHFAIFKSRNETIIRSLFCYNLTVYTITNSDRNSGQHSIRHLIMSENPRTRPELADFLRTKRESLTP